MQLSLDKIFTFILIFNLNQLLFSFINRFSIRKAKNFYFTNPINIKNPYFIFQEHLIYTFMLQHQKIIDFFPFSVMHHFFKMFLFLFIMN